MMKSAPSPETLLQIATTYGTPTYVYFEQVIIDRIRGLKQHLEGLPLQLLYAMKANNAVPVMKRMLKEGLGIDAVSPAELLLATELGFPADKILFSANNMTDDEMHFAQKKGVILNVGELSRLEKLGKAYPGSSVCVRLNPQIGAGHHKHVITAGFESKFGIPVEQIDQIHAIAKRYDLHIKGLHQHIGSGILDTDTLWKAINVMLDTSLSFDRLEFINVGGGLGIPYRATESGIPMDEFASKIVAPLKSFIASHPSGKLQIWFEPGRYFTAECGVLLATVNTIKHTEQITFAGVDSGMNHLVRPAMYGAYHEVVNLSNPHGELEKYDIVGNICESADFFAKGRMVQKLSEGDIVAVLDAGAYGMSMANTYNMRSLPAEVLVPAGSQKTVLIRSRSSIQDIVERTLRPA
jgi:diaminopimelate decarboxylase